MKMNQTSYMEASTNFQGYCDKCDKITIEEGIEPEANNQICEKCGKNAVMGMDEALMAGHIRLKKG